MVFQKLDLTSNTIEGPKELLLPLRHHQRVMLCKALSIEKNIKNSSAMNPRASSKEYKSPPFAFMCDKAGSGKTAVLVSLILFDKILVAPQRTLTLIVVPQNIHTQWIREIQKFSGDALKVKSYTEYHDISNVFFDSEVILENDVLITTILYHNTILTAFDQLGINVYRTIYDEVDSINNVITGIDEKREMLAKEVRQEGLFTMNNTPRNKGTMSKITWFVSASIYSFFTEENGFKFGNKVINAAENTVKCENTFIDSSNFKLDEPESIVFECDSIIDEYHDLLSINQLDAVNSLSFQNIYSPFTGKIANNEVDILIMIMEDYHLHLRVIDDTLRSLKKNRKITDDIAKQIENLKREREFYMKLVKLLHDLKCDMDCADKKDCFENTIYDLDDALDRGNTKLAVINELINNINSEDKVLIFSDFTGPFKLLGNLLGQRKIKHCELSGGNIKDIDKAISDYKTDNTSVLFIDSSSEGCGINLENTTKLIFLHRTSDVLRNQVIGRAQRPGRNSRLTIYTIINKNEIV